MSIKIGTTNIKDFRMGTTNVSKMYLGTTLVWTKDEINDTIEETELQLQDVATWRSDLDACASYIIEPQYSYLKEEADKYLTYTTTNNAFRIECHTTFTTSSFPQFNNFYIKRSDNGTIMKKNKFYKVSFKIRGKVDNEIGLGSERVFSFYNAYWNTVDYFNINSQLNIILTEQYQDVDCLIYTGMRNTLNDNYYLTATDLKRMDITLPYTVNGLNSRQFIKGDYIEIKDFRVKDYGTTYPPIPNNAHYSHLVNNKLPIVYESPKLAESSAYYYDCYSTTNSIKVVNTQDRKNSSSSNVLIRFYTEGSTIADTFFVEPCTKYHITGYIKGTPKKHGGLILNGYSIFDELEIAFDDTDYTFFDIVTPRYITANYDSYHKDGGLLENFSIGFSHKYGEYGEVQINKGDFIEIRNLVIERIE